MGGLKGGMMAGGGEHEGNSEHRHTRRPLPGKKFLHG